MPARLIVEPRQVHHRPSSAARGFKAQRTCLRHMERSACMGPHRRKSPPQNSSLRSSRTARVLLKPCVAVGQKTICVAMAYAQMAAKTMAAHSVPKRSHGRKASSSSGPNRCEHGSQT